MKKIVFALMAMSLMNVTFMSAQEEVSNNAIKGVSKGDLLVRLRGVGVVPNEDSKVGIIGGDVTLSNTFIPELDFTYFFTDHIAAELILGTSKHDVGVVNSAAGNVDLGSVWLLPPTLTAQYHFYTSSEKVFKPYIGAGLNYTLFYNVKSGDVADVSYDNALGYAAQIGFDLMINDKFFINVDAKRLFLSTDVTVDASNLAPGLSIPAEVDIDPWLLGFGIGMKF
ncbi:OmpW/AlkL family protein [Flavobacterium sp. N2270]|uniref:OmpW/AlkL family protein n=1 Tax=Flavobacterium sp. N2270 TaxID=2986831 RepID=UPI0022250583|nr:OmpW family outer membrane protein [Flavobacterium sp. N2270]